MRTLRRSLLALLIAGCGSGGTVQSVSMDQCPSGLRWTGGNKASAEMRPGTDCVGCHAERSGAPNFVVAGTVYSSVLAEDDCFGVEDAVVEIEDAEGRVLERTTNAAGNFFVAEGEQSVTFPITAAVHRGGETHRMVTEVDEGSCNSCHDGSSSSRTPARVQAP
jgi:hypothetical protein